MMVITVCLFVASFLTTDQGALAADRFERLSSADSNTIDDLHIENHDVEIHECLSLLQRSVKVLLKRQNGFEPAVSIASSTIQNLQLGNESQSLNQVVDATVLKRTRKTTAGATLQIICIMFLALAATILLPYFVNWISKKESSFAAIEMPEAEIPSYRSERALLRTQGTFLERQCGTAHQRAFLCFIVGQACLLLLSIGSSVRKPVAKGLITTICWYINYCANIFSSIVLLASWVAFLYAVHPTRILLSAGYDKGRRLESKSWYERHFGTDMLLGSQLQVMGVAIYIVTGIAYVLVVDISAWEYGSFYDMLMTARDGLGWWEIVGGLVASWATIVFNNMSYPENLTRARSPIADWLDGKYVRRILGYRNARWLQVHLLNDNLVFAWLLFGLGALMMLNAFSLAFGGSPMYALGNFVGAYFYLVGSLFLVYFAYSNGTVLDPVLFGCHRECPALGNHPMGPEFNAPFKGVEDVEMGLDAAAAVFDLTWIEQKPGLWLAEAGEFLAVKAELNISMHYFALAMLLRSSEFKRQDTTVEKIDVVSTLSDDAELLHVNCCANPPMPRSDKVFISALRELPLGKGHLIAEWAVIHPKYPEEPNTFRDLPFMAFRVLPIGTDSSSLTVCAVVPVPSWMPPVIVQEELHKAANELGALAKLPHNEEGAELLASVQREVWAAAAKEIPPCTWNLFVSCATGLEELGVPVDKSATFQIETQSSPENLLDALCALPDPHPIKVASLALAFANSDDWVKKQRKFSTWFSNSKSTDDVVESFTHKHLSGAFRGSVKVDSIHPMALALILSSPEFKRQNDESIIELREVKKLGSTSSIWYQRSKLSKLLKDRDALYTCMILEIDAARVLVVEWPVNLPEVPEIPGVQRTKSVFVYEIQRESFFVRERCVLAAVAVFELGGILGSQLLRPTVDQLVADELFRGLGEASTIFQTEDGRKVRDEVGSEVQKEICKELRKELSPAQLSFMECHSMTFRSYGT